MSQPLVIDNVEKMPQSMPRMAPVTAITPMAMIGQALEKGAGIEVISQLMALQERWDANQARKAFDAAMAAAKAEMPVIFKNRTVDFTSAKGRTHYRHEDLAEIARTVDPILAKHGLSYRFTTKSEGVVTVTCVISHRDGHFVENTLSGPRDESGNKNPIQQIGSTITFLQRYTLKAGLGLAASTDDDGRAAGAGATITDEQAEEITLLITESKSDVGLFLKFVGAESVADIRAADFPKAVGKLRAKIAKSRQGDQP